MQGIPVKINKLVRTSGVTGNAIPFGRKHLGIGY